MREDESPTSSRGDQYGHGLKLPHPSLVRFAISTLTSYVAARFLADFFHLRLFVTHERIHIHHFVLGLVLMPITWLAFEENRDVEAEVLAGAVLGLFLSELKQLVLEQWGP